jgi:two-component system phosphate regulon sensor histidine kinase PhoR
VSVRDSGVGMDLRNNRNLFQMFGTLKNTRQMNTNGIGLGLFICKKIVSQFEGTIIVKSKLN